MRPNAGLAALFLLALACNSEKRRLAEHLTQLEERRNTVLQRLTAKRNAMRDSQQRLDTLNADLTAHNTGVHTFLSNHRVAAECIRASRSTWGESNAFSNDVSRLTKFGAALCTVALLDNTFSREVTHVADKLAEADARVKELQQQVADAQRAVEADRHEVQREEMTLDEIAASMADVQRKLQAR